MHWLECKTKFCKGMIALHFPFEHLYFRDASEVISKSNGFLMSSTVIVLVLESCLTCRCLGKANRLQRKPESFKYPRAAQLSVVAPLAQ